jgi:hypothetical protein
MKPDTGFTVSRDALPRKMVAYRIHYLHLLAGGLWWLLLRVLGHTVGVECTTLLPGLRPVIVVPGRWTGIFPGCAAGKPMNGRTEMKWFSWIGQRTVELAQGKNILVEKHFFLVLPCQPTEQ